VVLELDVVARLVLLDDGVLKQQRFLFGRSRNELDVTRFLLQKAQLVATVATWLQVAAHATAQVRGFANVECLATCIAKQVNTRPGRKAADLVDDAWVHDRDPPLASARARTPSTHTSGGHRHRHPTPR